jgi:hypothetical protein
MPVARRLVWVLALLALVFAPARLDARESDARTVSAASLAPTLSAADTAPTNPSPVARETDAGAADLRPHPLLGWALAALVLVALAPDLRPRPAALMVRWRRRGPPQFLTR